MKQFLSICLILTGCVHGPTYEQQVVGYVGQPSSEVIRAFGIPSETFKYGQLRAIAYHKESGVSVSQRWGKLKSTQRYCKTTFVLDQNDLVDSIRVEGNECPN